MTTTSRPARLPDDLLELNTGDRMSREEFHQAYEKTPEGFKAELIGGIVYVASPLKHNHSREHVSLAGLLFAYESATPGVEAGDNATVLLGEESEPQPDLHLRILPECGGQSRITPDDYISGAPELVIEIALSNRSIDLHAKRNDYARYGVREYVVVCVREHEIRWFDLSNGRELAIGPDGVLRMQNYPGLWIDTRALFSNESARLMQTLQQGLSTAEHADFGARLAAIRSKAIPDRK